jgi:4,5-dihydroxyphthalate decarboxylase
MRHAPTLLGTYPHTAPLKTGVVKPRLLQLDFVDRSPVYTGFAEMIREQAYDVAELAIGAFFQAVASGSPIRLLPVVALGGFHHASIFVNAERQPVRPAELAGRRVAVRSFSQTTGLWVRAILQEEYGIRAGDITWVVTEPSHVASFHDPSNVEAAPPGEDVHTLLRSGAVDAAILGAGRGGGTIVPLIPEPQDSARAWYERHGFVPINHMVCVSGSLADEPELVADLVDAFARAAALTPEGDPAPGAVTSEILAALEQAMEAAVAQGLIPAALHLPALFAAGSALDAIATNEVNSGTSR